MRRAMARPRPVPPGVPCAGVVGHVDYGLSAFVV
jgi:hypothetical protein